MSKLVFHKPTGLWADSGYPFDAGYGVEPALDFSWFGPPPPFEAKNHNEWETLDEAIVDLKHGTNAYGEGCSLTNLVFDETDDEVIEIERCRQFGTICHLHWYPRTTVSFYTITAPTWDELLAEALKLQEEEINPKWKGVIDLPVQSDV